MTNKTEIIQKYLDELVPNVGCELNYNKDYELVIAVMLSAQTTDASVNNVTKILFKEYQNLEALSCAKIEDIEEIIKSLGLYKNKARNIIQISQILLDRYGGKIPSDKNELQTLPGVGNKTAGVIRAEIFKIPDFPVDTHIARISKRLGMAKQDDDPYKIEQKLKKLFPAICTNYNEDYVLNSDIFQSV